jgi:diguanylate cyclase (GGDEF)-like protein/PAS domain S-box-containing protein
VFPINSKKYLDSSLRDSNYNIQNSFHNITYEEQLPWVEAVLPYVHDAVILVNEFGSVILLNSMAEKITGWSSQEAKSLRISEVFLPIHELTSETPSPNLKISSSLQDSTSTFNHGFIGTKDGDCSRSIEYTIQPIRDQNLKDIGTAIVFREIVKTCHISHHESWQINHDFLTGLMNRTYFECCLNQAVLNASESTIGHVLCYLDFDHFRVINETLSYAAGDEYLRRISLILQQRVRKTDILARLGGDEFGLILYQCNLEQARKVLQTICAEIQAFKFVWEEKSFSCSVSAGISVLSAQSMSPSQMLIAANSACEIAKSKGRNRIHVYQPDDRDIAVAQAGTQWIPRLYRALEENQFCLYFQPIIPVEVKSPVCGQTFCASFEILLRLQDDLGGLIAPGHFIPVAEQYGLMHLLDRWVIRNLFQYLECQTIETLYPEQEGADGYLFMVNLSGASLNDDQFLDFVKAQFAAYSVAPHMICFEITETMAITNLNKAIHLIQQLKAIGCSFALDDFGSGMSSLAYLKNLPIDYLKIDGVFIKDIAHNPVDCKIVEAIHHMAHAMGIQTIAEFVENTEILTTLKTLGINYAQGYGIARPAPLCQGYLQKKARNEAQQS